MDGNFAKQILIGLAKKLGFADVRRANYNRKFQLKLVCENGSAPLICVKEGVGYTRMLFSSGKWEKMLNELKGHYIFNPKNGFANHTIVKIDSIEQLIIDLEIDGCL